MLSCLENTNLHSYHLCNVISPIPFLFTLMVLRPGTPISRSSTIPFPLNKRKTACRRSHKINRVPLYHMNWFPIVHWYVGLKGNSRLKITSVVQYFSLSGSSLGTIPIFLSIYVLICDHSGLPYSFDTLVRRVWGCSGTTTTPSSVITLIPRPSPQDVLGVFPSFV